MHTHLSIIPDSITVAPRPGGMVNVSLLSDCVHGSTCNDKGRTVARVDGTHGHISAMLFSRHAASLATDLLGSLSPSERAAVIQSFITIS